jgi:hypothetical protein
MSVQLQAERAENNLIYYRNRPILMNMQTEQLTIFGINNKNNFVLLLFA